MENLVITHTNFKQQRLAYGISLEDISKKSGLSISCISAFERFTSKYTETRTRDENASTITQALNDLIEERLTNLFAKKAAKEEKKMNAKNVNVEYDRVKIGKKIRKYCDVSNIGLVEFCRMCDIGIDSFSDSRAARSPYVYSKTLRKICKATGWDVETLIGPDDILIKKPVTTATYDQKGYIPPVDVIKTSNAKLLSEGPTGKIFDEKLICQDGRYFHEYKCTYIRKEEITKEQFINLINKKEEN